MYLTKSPILCTDRPTKCNWNTSCHGKVPACRGGRIVLAPRNHLVRYLLTYCSIHFQLWNGANFYLILRMAGTTCLPI